MPEASRKLPHSSLSRTSSIPHRQTLLDCTFLLTSGIPKVAQKIMRHTDVNLTLGLYTHTMQGQEAAAIESLPDLSAPSKEQQRSLRTGTTDTDNFLSKSCFQGGKTRTDTDTSGRTTALIAQKRPLEGSIGGTIKTL